jgi:hypothetical protein
MQVYWFSYTLLFKNKIGINRSEENNYEARIKEK